MEELPGKNGERNKEPWLGVLMSFALVGGGQFYTGRFVRGIVYLSTFILLSIFGIFALFGTNWPINICFCIFSVFPILLLNCIDAFRIIKKSNSVQFELTRKQEKDPWLAVFLASLLPIFGFIYLRKWFALTVYILSYLIIVVLLDKSLLESVILFLFVLLSYFYVFLASPNPRTKKVKHLIAYLAFRCVVTVVLPLLLALFMKAFFVEAVQVPTHGMKPTIHAGDRVTINKINYWYDDPTPGDIVLITMPESWRMGEGGRTLRRIIAIGSETIELTPDGWYVDDQLREFSSLPWTIEIFDQMRYNAAGQEARHGTTYKSYGILRPYTIPDRSYFVLGDNLAMSMDSRIGGPVPEEFIIGKATRIYEFSDSFIDMLSSSRTLE